VKFDLLHILIVDDNHNMRVLLGEILRAIGVRHVVEAEDGDEAMSTLRQHRIDIIITDLAMSPLDGMDFLRLLRNSPHSPSPMCPVLMISGHSTERRVREARDAGVNAFLSKPVTARSVLERLSELIEHPRPFVRCETYFGPDRRRRQELAYDGPRRRETDHDLML